MAYRYRVEVKRFIHALALVAVATVLMSCIKADVYIEVQDDGLMRAESVITGPLNDLEDSPRFDTSLFDELGMRPCEFVQATGNDIVESSDPRLGVRMVSPIKKGGSTCGLKTELFYDPTIEPFDGGDAYLQDLFGRELGERQLQQVGDGWEFETPFALSDVAGTYAGWFGPNASGLPFRDLASIGEPIEMTIRVKLPGQAIEGRHNATSVDGGEFTWKIDYDNPPTRLFAATEPSAGLSSSVFIIGGAVAAITLGLVGVGLQLRNARQRSASSNQKSHVAAGQPGQTVAPAQASSAEPSFDAANNVWVLHDPARGKLWFHESSREWVPY